MMRAKSISRFVIFGVMSVAIVPACVATAQTGVTPVKIHLVRRGIVGDAYRYTFTSSAVTGFSFDVKMEGSLLAGNHPQNETDKETHFSTEIVRSVVPTGDFSVEVSTPLFYTDTVENGVAKREPNPEHHDLVVYKPDGSELSRKTLLAVKPKEDPDVDIERWLALGAFPKQDLAVGDTWKGDFDAKLDFDDPRKRPTMVHFTGALTGVETKHGISCARLEYTANIGRAFLEGMVRMMSGQLPGSKDVSGVPITDGKLIVWLSLDRGAVIEYNYDISVTFGSVATIKAKNGNVLGTVTLKGPMRMSGTCVATAAPKFDVTLATASK